MALIPMSDSRTLRPPYERCDIDGPAYWTAVVGQQELGLSRDCEVRADPPPVIHRSRHFQFYLSPGSCLLRKYVCGVVPSIVRNISMKALTLS
jgi:hypothetical protein